MDDKRYLIVDKETGEVVGESNSPREPRRPFMTFLSWIVLCIFGVLLRYVVYYYLMLIWFLLDKIYNFSNLAFYIVLFLGGATALCILTYILMIGGHWMFSLSERVHPSKRGTRYVVFGIVLTLLYILLIVLMVAGFATNQSVFLYVFSGFMTIFYIVFSILPKRLKMEKIS